MKRYHVIFEGQVQGVGFRWVCLRYAQQFNITGTVRNMSNGMVEMFAQGTEENIDRMLASLQQGNSWVRIDGMNIKEVPVDPHELEFKPIL